MYLYIGAATVGCVILGPVAAVGIAVTAVAAVGIAQQIPEEQRSNLQAKAQETFKGLHDKAVEASENLSTSCAATYNDSGVAEHLPQCLSGECLAGNETAAKDHESTKSENLRGGATEGVPSKGMPRTTSLPGPKSEIVSQVSPAPKHERMRNKKVACLRDGESDSGVHEIYSKTLQVHKLFCYPVPFLPAGQIHGLETSQQPKAWLEIVASSLSSGNEKIEAMEEILILAKDKRAARIFLDEGILDSIIWTLSRYFEKVGTDERKADWVNATVSANERAAARLAAACCINLGKAHCAAIHTEGDLLLMSKYEGGLVPEERQVAQMLHEVPHHARVTKTEDPTIIQPSMEVFALKQLTLPQAEALAQSIKAVADHML